MTQTPPRTPETRPHRNIFGNLLLGLKILLGELQWIGLKALRAFELRQLRKRLKEECATLGEAVARQLADKQPGEPGEPGEPGSDTPLPPCDERTRLALKQVRFLEDEIEHLVRERQRMREEFEARRKSSLGANQEP
jgi:hypothetical protein